jgi:hypothetical protein
MAHMTGINEVASVLSRSKPGNDAASGDTEVIPRVAGRPTVTNVDCLENGIT